MIQQWIHRIRDYPQLELEHEALKKTLLEWEKIVTEQVITINELDTKLIELEKKPSVDDATYWNEKWTQSTVFYSAPKRKKVISYVKYKEIPEIKVLAEYLIDNGANISHGADGVILKVLKWLDAEFKSKRFKYKLDKGEQWSEPEELLKRGFGDCDDWGILEYHIIRQIFKTLNVWETVKHRLKCVAGNVNNIGSIPSGAGGHFYLIWLSEDGEWYTVESTYYRNIAIQNFGKKSQKLNPMYGTIWFSFTEYASWSQKSLTVSKDDFKKSG
jgi:hypothetical protein